MPSGFLLGRAGFFIVPLPVDASGIRSITSLGEVPIQSSFAPLNLRHISGNIAIIFKFLAVNGKPLLEKI